MMVLCDFGISFLKTDNVLNMYIIYYIYMIIYIYISDIIENEENMLTDAACIPLQSHVFKRCCYHCLLQRHRVFGFDELEQGMMRLEFAPKDLQAEG